MPAPIESVGGTKTLRAPSSNEMQTSLIATVLVERRSKETPSLGSSRPKRQRVGLRPRSSSALLFLIDRAGRSPGEGLARVIRIAWLELRSAN